ncbi:MAG: CopG family transcriptional regulator [Acidimicrobiales bacterium]
MRRTNIYLTDAEHAALGGRARASGSTRSQVLREILDHALGLAGPSPDDLDEIDAALAHCSDHLSQRARELVGDDPDLAIA